LFLINENNHVDCDKILSSNQSQNQMDEEGDGFGFVIYEGE
jgi:hypothetical protein